MTALRVVLIVLLTAIVPVAALQLEALTQGQEPSTWSGDEPQVEAPTWQTQLHQLTHAAARLPIAAGLAAALALRPRRKGTPPRNPSVIQTQIILAVVGAVVMLVVGSSLARAFGIVGAAGLVRYRAKIDDPKDAGVMLSTLAIGLAAGVGMWMISAFTTVFVLGVLWVIESFERAKKHFTIKIQTSDPDALKPRVQDLFDRQKIEYELRSTTEDELWYDVRMPLERRTDRLSAVILKMDGEHVKGVEFDEKKSKK